MPATGGKTSSCQVWMVHLAGSGGEPAGPSNSSAKMYGPPPADGGASGADGVAQAPGRRIAAPSMPIPDINIMLRRSIYKPPIVQSRYVKLGAISPGNSRKRCYETTRGGLTHPAVAGRPGNTRSCD